MRPFLEKLWARSRASIRKQGSPPLSTGQDYDVNQMLDMQEKGGQREWQLCIPSSWAHRGLPPAVRENRGLLCVLRRIWAKFSWVFSLQVKKMAQKWELGGDALSQGWHCCSVAQLPSHLVQGYHPEITFHHPPKDPCHLVLGLLLPASHVLLFLDLFYLVQYFLQ